jgi:histidinol-phosphate aminotransferase
VKPARALPLPRPHLKHVPIYKPGKPIEEVQRELGLGSVIKLASNENPLGPSPRALRAMRRAAAQAHRYPEGGAPLLRQALAKRFKLGPEHFIFGNGSNEILIFAAQAFAGPGAKAVFSQRSFAVYSIATRLVGARPVMVPSPDGMHDLRSLARAAKGAALLYLCNPNNPTGSWHPDKAIEAVLKAVPARTTVVLDAAYAEYCGHSPAQDAAWVRRYPNLLICRTFSKAYGLAGLRIGYGIAQPWLIAELERCRQPFNTSGPAQAAALAALDDAAFVRRSVAVNSAGLKQVFAGLKRLGLRALPSRANFIWFFEPAQAAPGGKGWYQWLLRGGVVVRPVEPGSLRVSVGTRAENARFLKRLAEGMDR